MRVLLAAIVKEIRESLRDPHVLAFSFGMPLVMYPLLIWGAMQIALLERGLGETDPPVVAVTGPADLVEALAAPPAVRAPPGVAGAPEAERATLLDRGTADLFVDGTEGVGLSVRVDHLSTRPASARALEQARERLDALREARRRELAAARGLEPAALDPWTVRTDDIAPKGQTLALLISMIIPMILMMNMLLAGVYPTVEAVVAERERGTIETTMVAAAPRALFVLAKVAAIVVVLLLSTAGNVLALGLTLLHVEAQMGRGTDGALSFQAGELLLALAVVVVSAVLVAGVLALSALPARNFKEGQNLVSIASLVGMAAVTVGFLPLVELSPATALVPLANTVLVLRDAISAAPLSRGDAALAFTVDAAAAGATLWLGGRVVSGEGYLFADRLPGWLAVLRRRAP